MAKHEHNIRVGDDSYTILFNNRGLREAEGYLGDAGDDLAQRIASGRLGNRVQSALMWGGTRKHHSRDLPTVESVDDLIDTIYDEFEDEDDPNVVAERFILPLMAAYLKQPIDRLRKLMNGEVDPAELEAEPSANGSSAQGKGASAGSKAKSGAGSGSSGKESSAA